MLRGLEGIQKFHCLLHFNSQKILTLIYSINTIRDNILAYSILKIIYLCNAEFCDKCVYNCSIHFQYDLEAKCITEDNGPLCSFELWARYVDQEEAMLTRRTSLMMEYQVCNRALDRAKPNRKLAVSTMFFLFFSEDCWNSFYFLCFCSLLNVALRSY